MLCGLAAIMLAACSGGSDLSKDAASKFNLDLLPCYGFTMHGSPVFGYYTIHGEKISYDGLHDYDHPQLGMFYDGYAMVRTPDFTGYINDYGMEMITLEEGCVPNRFITEDRVVYVKDKEIVVSDTKGNALFTLEGRWCSPFRAGYALFTDSHSDIGVVDADGNIVFEPGMDERIPTLSVMMSEPASLAHPTWFPIYEKNHGFSYFLDVATGEHYFEDKMPSGTEFYDQPMVDGNDLVMVKYDGKYGLLDLNGLWVVEPVYNRLQYDCGWYAFRGDDGLWGWIDAKGVVKIEAQFDLPNHLKFDGFGFGNNDLCYIGEGRFIDRSGNIALETDRIIETGFIGDRCLFKDTTGGYMWMNRKGEVINGIAMPLAEGTVWYLKKLAIGYAPQYFNYGL